MSSEVKANKVSPATGTDFTFGDSGDTFTVPSGATLAVTGATVTGLSAGKVLQVVNTIDQTSASGTGILSWESTSAITTSMGTEFLTASITPNSATNRLVIQCNWNGTAAGGGTISIALFQDATTNALACVAGGATGYSPPYSISMLYEMAAGTTSATTFKIRAGANGASTTYMNNWSGGFAWGGTPVSTLQIWEIEV